MSIRSLSLYPTSRGYLKIRHINNSIHTHLVTMLNSRIRNQEKKQCILYSIFKGIKTASWGIFSFLYLCLFLNLDLMPNCHYFKKNQTPNQNNLKKKKKSASFSHPLQALKLFLPKMVQPVSFYFNGLMHRKKVNCITQSHNILDYR